MSTPIVVVGAGHAGVHTALRLVELGYRGELILIDEEDGLPYERPPLSKDVLASAESHEPPPRSANRTTTRTRESGESRGQR
ncbi:FAD-dependent oxidoreductase [Rhodococcus opacus]|nr:FAD-dependent oxidoreductase [Rhodococcus opacus]